VSAPFGGSRFGSVEALRRLGIPDPEVYAPDNLVQTMQVLDLSRSVATEPVEARGYVCVYLLASGGHFGTWELYSKAPGGIVIENLMVTEQPSSFPAGTVLAVRDTRVTVPAAPGVQIGCSIGGEPVRSDWGFANLVAPLVGPDLQIIPFINNPNQQVQVPMRIYVPAGSVLVVHCTTGGTNMVIGAVWRELQDWQPA
jgi:hypothetical protein